MITVNDFIKHLQGLKPELRGLPLVIKTENGMIQEPCAKVLLDKHQTLLDEPKTMILTDK